MQGHVSHSLTKPLVEAVLFTASLGDALVLLTLSIYRRPHGPVPGARWLGAPQDAWLRLPKRPQRVDLPSVSTYDRPPKQKNTWRFPFCGWPLNNYVIPDNFEDTVDAQNPLTPL